MGIELALVGPVATGPDGGVDWERMVATYGGHLERCVVAGMHRFGWRSPREEVEDVAQEVWQRLVERAAATGPEWWHWPAVRARAYLGRVAHNAVVDFLRRRGAAKRGGRLLEPRDGELAAAALERHPDPEMDPEGRLLAREQRAGLCPRLAALLGGRRAHRDARILLLAVVDGCSPEEIAAGLDGALAASSVYSVLHRARRVLARHGRAALLGALNGEADGGAELAAERDLGSCALAG